jgi:uncharacterized membrane protein YcaP (DUF421 family)
MFHLGTPLWQIAVRAVLVYLAVFLALRVAGKRELGQMTVFDLVLILLIANAVQNAMVGPDTSLQGGLAAAVVLVVVNVMFGLARIRSPLLDRLFQGHPTVLVENGQVMWSHLRRQGLDEEDLDMAIREHGIDSLKSVQMAVLETDGSISIVPMSSQVFRSRRRRARAIRRHG